MQLTTFLTAILATGTTATVVRIHSLNHCRASPVDLQCGHLKTNHCCSLGNNANAHSIQYIGVKGRRILATKKHCKKTVYKEIARTKNRCVYDGVFTGGKYRNPLNSVQAEEQQCCEGESAPDQAVVFGSTTLDLAAMTPEQVEVMNALAGNGTSVEEWPEELTALIVPTEEE